MTIIGPNDGVLNLAQEINNVASAVTTTYDHARKQLGNTEWEGRRAERARADITGLEPKVEALSSELLALKQILERHAQWIDDTRRELLEIQRCFDAKYPVGDPLRYGKPDRYSTEWWRVKRDHNL